MDQLEIARTSKLPIVVRLRVGELPAAQASQLRLQMIGNALGQIIHLPVIVVRGSAAGPTLGVTAAIHGNEINGVHSIHRLLEAIDPVHLAGTLIAVPVVNVPGYLNHERQFNDGQDLNRIMPGAPKGRSSMVYAHRFMTRVVTELDYLIDLHTASTGRINSLYVRADLSHATAAELASVQHAEIIVNNTGPDGTLRGACMQRGIPSITVEAGNPQQYQPKMVTRSVEGILNVMAKLGMVQRPVSSPRIQPVVCKGSYWIYTESGGVLEVFPHLCDRIAAGQLVARVSDVYGNVVEEYRAPTDGIVIGRSVNPVNQTGSRVLHVGLLADEAFSEALGRVDSSPRGEAAGAAASSKDTP